MSNAAVISVFGLERFLLRDDLTAAAGVTSQNGAVPVIRNFVRVTIAADATSRPHGSGDCRPA